MRYVWLRRHLPAPLYRHVFHWEASIDRAVAEFAASLPERAWVLDAGAGEMQHAPFFSRQRYVGVDLGVGDPGWDYGKLSALADLQELPFREGAFDACLNVVTLEHLKDPGGALREMARTLKSGGRLLLIAPHEWEVHQSPHDYFRFTRHGLQYLLGEAGFETPEIRPLGGFFRLLSRRLLNGVQFFGGIWKLPAALVLAPPALLLPFLDGLDRRSDFTLGYLCYATKP